jgi:hypothetical protein
MGQIGAGSASSGTTHAGKQHPHNAREKSRDNSKRPAEAVALTRSFIECCGG